MRRLLHDESIPAKQSSAQNSTILNRLRALDETAEGECRFDVSRNMPSEDHTIRRIQNERHKTQGIH